MRRDWLRTIALVFAGQVGTVAVSLVTGMWITRTCPVENVGWCQITATWMALGSTLALGGHATVVSRLVAAGEDPAGALRSWVTRRVRRLGWIWCGTGLLTAACLAWFRPDDPMTATCAWAAASIPGGVQLALGNALLLATGQAQRTLVTQGLNSLGLLVGTLMVTSGRASIGWVPAATILAQTVAARVACRPQPGPAQERADTVAIADLRNRERPVRWMTWLDAIVWQRSELVLLGWLAPASEAARYGLPFGLATLAMRLIPGSVVACLVPAMAPARTRPEAANLYRESVRGMAMLAWPLAAGGVAVSAALVHALWGEGYAASAPILGLLLLAQGCTMVLGYPASSLVYATGDPTWLLRAGLPVALLDLGLAAWWIPANGALGATWACVLAQLASLVPGVWFAWKLSGAWPPWKTIGRLAALAILTGLVARGLVSAVAGWPGLLLAIAGGGTVHAWLIWNFGGLSGDERTRLLRALVRRRTGRSVT
ncbi:MAG: polysaccharide biosynthesis C-terminal domain-containing protein [bacterium]|nr:polysaccharide biosynthesis C-terminal domain-containing protein [bacterium]